jgi:hypothetical protein
MTGDFVEDVIREYTRVQEAWLQTHSTVPHVVTKQRDPTCHAHEELRCSCGYGLRMGIEIVGSTCRIKAVPYDATIH